MHIDVGIFGPLMAGTIWLLAVILGWPAGRPGAAVAVLAGYVAFLLLIQVLGRRPGSAPPPLWRPGRGGRR